MESSIYGRTTFEQFSDIDHISDTLERKDSHCQERQQRSKTYPSDLRQGHKPVVIDVNGLPHPLPLPLGLGCSYPRQPRIDPLPVDDGDITRGHSVTPGEVRRTLVTLQGAPEVILI